jgi:hypothetical protein
MGCMLIEMRFESTRYAYRIFFGVTRVHNEVMHLITVEVAHAGMNAYLEPVWMLRCDDSDRNTRYSPEMTYIILE